MYVGAVALALTVAACSSSDAADTAPTQAEASPTEVTQAEVTQAESTPDASGTVGEVDSGGTAPSAGSAPVDPGVVVPEALQFTAPLVGGGEFSGAAVADKPTVFWFWAPT